ncbi:hypothetical protein BDB00DRAFT_939752 [Zychaea mexicana]|uniref:uncharacterized protein n=1 Tax=Zychaea mexicana TaxID=64656 RepID=UPI0022FDB942|nr:uncharacterized protein BDB00DRAFT_939752 [Zychaea mexicana]KAI9492276.1 hypothetical protein BDB00DRAFT_939752 [Zychaea mexicana]
MFSAARNQFFRSNATRSFFLHRADPQTFAHHSGRMMMHNGPRLGGLIFGIVVLTATYHAGKHRGAMQATSGEYKGYYGWGCHPHYCHHCQHGDPHHRHNASQPGVIGPQQSQAETISDSGLPQNAGGHMSFTLDNGLGR